MARLKAFLKGTRLTFSCLRRYVMALLLLFLTEAALVVVIALWFQPHLITYCISVLLPTILAALVVSISIMQSRYLKVVIERALKRKDQHAGLAFLRSDKGRVLLNRQTEPPWEGMWLLPGGYFNPTEGDQVTADTAVRRLQKLEQSTTPFAAKVHVARTNDSYIYIELMLEYGHVPTLDEVYLVLTPGQVLLPETDVHENNNLRWVSPIEIRSDAYQVPPHMKELILYLLETNPSAPAPRCWEILSEYQQFYLDMIMNHH